MIKCVFSTLYNEIIQDESVSYQRSQNITMGRIFNNIGIVYKITEVNELEIDAAWYASISPGISDHIIFRILIPLYLYKPGQME